MPYEFSGDVPTRAELLDGPIRDLNLFWRPELYRAHYEILELELGRPYSWKAQGQVGFVFLAQGRLEGMSPWDTLKAHKGERHELRSLTPNSRAVRIQIDAIDSGSAQARR